MIVKAVNTWTNKMDIYYDVTAMNILQTEGRVKLTGKEGQTITLELENIVRIEA